jgi:hypothetical protein
MLNISETLLDEIFFDSLSIHVLVWPAHDLYESVGLSSNLVALVRQRTVHFSILSLVC